jgi:FdhE protein
MTIGQGKLAEYDRTIERARKLAREYTFAAKPLQFYEKLLVAQKGLYSTLAKTISKQEITHGRDEVRGQLDLMVLLPNYPEFLALVQSNAPEPLARAAGECSRKGSGAWVELLSEYWANGGRPNEDGVSRSSEEMGALREFLARGFLQTYAEFLSEGIPEPLMDSTSYVCPKCDSLPVLGVLRPEGDGGRRFLRCAFCSHEWGFRRILCAACGEEREEKLPVYVAEQFPHIRVECCDTCKHYLRTVDLTKNGNALPEADDLAAIPLTLWAQEYGYRRIHTNLLGA